MKYRIRSRVRYRSCKTCSTPEGVNHCTYLHNERLHNAQVQHNFILGHYAVSHCGLHPLLLSALHSALSSAVTAIHCKVAKYDILTTTMATTTVAKYDILTTTMGHTPLCKLVCQAWHCVSIKYICQTSIDESTQQRSTHSPKGHLPHKSIQPRLFYSYHST